MIRANNVISATSTSGSGPYTLAAAPTSLGAIDLYTALSVQNLGTAAATSVPLVLTEYTDNTFTTALNKMGFIGGVKLGTNLATTTVTVQTVLWTQTGLNTSSPTYSVSSPTAISVTTAANTLIEIDQMAELSLASSPYVLTSATDGWFTQAVAIGAGVTQPSYTAGSGVANFEVPIVLLTPIRIKTMAVYLTTGQVGGSVSYYYRIYGRSTAGDLYKLLADFTGATPVSWIVPNNSYVSASLASPILLAPGSYWAEIRGKVTSPPSTNPAYLTNPSVLSDGTFGVSAGINISQFGSTGGGNTGAGADPVTTTINTLTPSGPIPCLFFKSS